MSTRRHETDESDSPRPRKRAGFAVDERIALDLELVVAGRHNGRRGDATEGTGEGLNFGGSGFIEPDR